MKVKKKVRRHNVRSLCILDGVTCPSIYMRANFLVSVSAKSLSNISPNPSEIMSKVSKPYDNLKKIIISGVLRVFLVVKS